ncbi:DUF2076 domain-containing protein [Sphingomonas morindae]|uniref:DUF2076 domain-containing protein n=1 Tax=Sphingomonas morindae TaxID=1541170 RepID=A0ABY4XE22_9SPHN|nr:DUF2076 domain-containing protein [Sphingomonas morindae]USI74976.1 DUF2076 domain-containing protein [Sphingomonas morindae]
MTPDERALLARYLDDLNATRGVRKDAEADALIRQALSANPDAAYLLVQHAIVADQSLYAAQARIEALEAQLRETPPPSFLPPASPWRSSGAPAYAAPDVAPPPPQQRPGLFSADSGLGSFLRNAGTTAAGVAGGEMLFSGLSDLFGHHGDGALRDRPEETVVNNFYGDDGDGDMDRPDDPGNW